MGAAAGTLANASNGLDLHAAMSKMEDIKCNLSDELVSQYVSQTHFSAPEVAALHIHYEHISATRREDGLIDRQEFQAALGFIVSESLYVDRVFQTLDSNSDGFISFEEFVTGVSVLSSKGNQEEKIKFSFNVLDFNGDGMIDDSELRNMLKACVGENSVSMNDDHIEQMIKSTFETVDTDKDGLISLSEYKSLVEKEGYTLNHLTVNIARLIAEHAAVLQANNAAAAAASTAAASSE